MNQKNSSQELLSSYLNRFSHIYVEEDILQRDETKRILDKFPNSNVITIKNYKDVFNRSRQDFNVQKNSQKLILAWKKTDLLYKGSPLCEDFGKKNFYYSSSILNCIFDCKYCYLRGMYPSSNIVVFVNIDDFLAEAEKTAGRDEMYLCISYDSDMMALESIVGFTKKWIEFANCHRNITIEIRTKSCSFKNISSINIPENVILAWTLLPDEIIQAYEMGTPSLEKRLDDMELAVKSGYKIRISIEPIMNTDNFEYVYRSFLKKVFTRISPRDIREVNLGAFRMSREHLKLIRKVDPFSSIFGYPIVNSDFFCTYENGEELKDKVFEYLREYLPLNKIY